MVRWRNCVVAATLGCALGVVVSGPWTGSAHACACPVEWEGLDLRLADVERLSDVGDDSVEGEYWAEEAAVIARGETQPAKAALQLYSGGERLEDLDLLEVEP